MKSIEEIKNEIAVGIGHKNWKEFKNCYEKSHPFKICEIAMTDVAMSYANQQTEIAVDRAIEMIASKSQEMIYDRQDTKLNPDGGLILMDFQVCYAVHKQSILSLRNEILKDLHNTDLIG